ncbi:helix-turn-helix domain-containing protein [Rhizobacter sp. Root1221]|uniref:winged helix-turn-helix transcriptional regulator n=1 Tax=Rhizobacter sp. Root1221 TaxID=1736433 RepID=UPI0006FA6171|nr:helix-turn-helix domain-containing protein [Rhizobacter sp. Root1221]KQV97521.1 PadR family transcriptional regulator [Rhizobacter sp. Root1221]
MKPAATQSAADVYSETCPSRRALELIANKWALLVVPALRRGPVRNNELLRQVGGISQKMLTQTLRELELNGLVVRSDHGTVPPRVDYALTELGASLSKALLAVDRWAEAHHDQLRPASRRTGR